MPIVKIVAVILCLALTLTACGGGSGSTDSAATSKTYRLSLRGNLTAGAAKGIQFDLLLAPGVTVNVDGATSALLPSSLAVTASDALVESRLFNGTVTAAIVTATGLGAGEFATLTCNLTQASAPAASSFTVQNVKVIDTNGDAIPGVSVLLE